MASDRGIQRVSAGRFRVQIRRQGFAAQSAYFKSLAEARKWRKEKLAAIDLNLSSARQSAAENKTLANLIDEYVLEFKVDVRGASYRHLVWWKGRLGSKALSKIKPADIAEQLRFLSRSDKRHGGSVVTARAGERLSPATINRYHAALSKVLNVAVSKWHLLESNPARRIQRNPEKNERNRWLQPDEVSRLIASCRQSRWGGLALLVQLALCTGARRSELANLRWGDLRIEKSVAYAQVQTSKNRESRTLVIVGDALRELREWRSSRNAVTDLVFPSIRHPLKPFRNLDGYWKRALADAEIQDFRFHDLRHTAASYLTQAGVPAITVAAILGHKTLQMTKRYSHLAIEHQRDAVMKVFGGH